MNPVNCAQLGTILGVSHATISAYIARGYFVPVSIVGRQKLFDLEQVKVAVLRNNLKVAVGAFDNALES